MRGTGVAGQGCAAGGRRCRLLAAGGVARAQRACTPELPASPAVPQQHTGSCRALSTSTLFCSSPAAAALLGGGQRCRMHSPAVAAPPGHPDRRCTAQPDLAPGLRGVGCGVWGVGLWGAAHHILGEALVLLQELLLGELGDHHKLGGQVLGVCDVLLADQAADVAHRQAASLLAVQLPHLPLQLVVLARPHLQAPARQLACLLPPVCPRPPPSPSAPAQLLNRPGRPGTAGAGSRAPAAAQAASPPSSRPPASARSP